MKFVTWVHNSNLNRAALVSLGHQVIAIKGTLLATKKDDFINVWVWNKRMDTITFFDRLVLTEEDKGKNVNAIGREAIQAAVENQED